MGRQQIDSALFGSQLSVLMSSSHLSLYMSRASEGRRRTKGRKQGGINKENTAYVQIKVERSFSRLQEETCKTQ